MADDTATRHTKGLRPIIRKYFLIAFVVWTVFIMAFLFWDANEIRRFVVTEAKSNAVANYNKDIAFREWATTHGGVYVPVDGTTQPNPYLTDVKERDIVTPSGRHLTLMNPAYMARQMNEFFAQKGNIFGHITSLHLKNPINKPDIWEENALKAFEKGETERTEVADIGGKPFLRLIRPIFVQEGCLKCHNDQGYKVGDIRGGVGVSVGLGPYFAEARALTRKHAVAGGFIWLFGSLGLLTGYGFARRLGRVSDESREALAESETLLNQTQQISHVGGWGFTVSSRNMQWTEETYRIYEVDTDFDPNNISANVKFYAPSDRAIIEKAFKRAVEYGAPYDLELRFTGARGTNKWVRTYAEVEWSGGKVSRVYGNIIDVTTRKQAELELVAAKEAADEANRLKSEFLSNMTHELNTPLTSVLGYSRLANDRERELAANLARVGEVLDRPDNAGAAWPAEARSQIKSAIETIQEIAKYDTIVLGQGERLFNLLNDLMDLSRLESGHIKAAEQSISTFMLLSSIERYYKDAAMMKGLAFFDNASDFRPHDLLFIGDRKWLEKALGNLVQNAIKFSGSGKIRVTASRDGTNILFRVSDEGMGIQDDDRNKLFESFRQLDGSSTRAQGGVGLGLAFSQKLVQAMGGDISVRSEAGKGSEFTITIPYRPPGSGVI